MKVSLVVDFGCASLVVVLILKGFGCVSEYGEVFGCVSLAGDGFGLCEFEFGVLLVTRVWCFFCDFDCVILVGGLLALGAYSSLNPNQQTANPNQQTTNPK